MLRFFEASAMSSAPERSRRQLKRCLRPLRSLTAGRAAESAIEERQRSLERSVSSKAHKVRSLLLWTEDFEAEVRRVSGLPADPKPTFRAIPPF
jgi:hypothetical protein